MQGASFTVGMFCGHIDSSKLFKETNKNIAKHGD